MIRYAAFLVVLFVSAVGCRQPMGQQQYPLMGNRAFSGGQMDPAGAQYMANQGAQQQFGNLAGEIQALNSRLSSFNADNDNLYAQVASLQQQLQVSQNYSEALKERLAATFSQVQQLQTEKEQAQQRTAATPSTGQPGNPQFAGATIRANNSLMSKLQNVQMPGVTAWMDGDVIRVEIPTDQLLVPGKYEIQSTHYKVLQDLVSAIRQSFSEQRIGVEAHWDGTPIEPSSMSHHQLTATQAIAVFNYLVQAGLPNEQLFIMGMGSNRPRYNVTTQNGIYPNRRVEIVIYPETYR